MMALSAKEASDTRSEVAASLYRRLLKEEVTSRRIDAAESPAKVSGARYSGGMRGMAYRRLLREELTSRRIDSILSWKLLGVLKRCLIQLLPAHTALLMVMYYIKQPQVLGDLVQRSGFSPEAALEMHKQLYRGKLNTVRGVRALHGFACGEDVWWGQCEAHKQLCRSKLNTEGAACVLGRMLCCLAICVISVHGLRLHTTRAHAHALLLNPHS